MSTAEVTILQVFTAFVAAWIPGRTSTEVLAIYKEFLLRPRLVTITLGKEQ